MDDWRHAPSSAPGPPRLRVRTGRRLSAGFAGRGRAVSARGGRQDQATRTRQARHQWSGRTVTLASSLHGIALGRVPWLGPAPAASSCRRTESWSPQALARPERRPRMYARPTSRPLPKSFTRRLAAETAVRASITVWLRAQGSPGRRAAAPAGASGRRGRGDSAMTRETYGRPASRLGTYVMETGRIFVVLRRGLTGISRFPRSRRGSGSGPSGWRGRARRGGDDQEDDQVADRFVRWWPG